MKMKSLMKDAKISKPIGYVDLCQDMVNCYTLYFILFEVQRGIIFSRHLKCKSWYKYLRLLLEYGCLGKSEDTISLAKICKHQDWQNKHQWQQFTGTRPLRSFLKIIWFLNVLVHVLLENNRFIAQQNFLVRVLPNIIFMLPEKFRGSI